MLNQAELAYFEALLAVKRKEYRSASDHFDRAAPFFTGNKEFNLLRETNRLLLAVKREINGSSVTEGLEVEEMFSNG